MDRRETMQIFSVLKAAYPHSFKGVGKEDADAMISLWQKMFETETYEQVNAAVAALIATRKEGYTPTIGEVKERLAFAVEQASGALNEQGAWALVEKACRNGLYGYREEFERLPDDVQRAVGAPEQLRAWAMMDTETVNSVVASNFMRNYRTQKQREKEFAMIPPSVQRVLSEIAEKAKLEAKAEKKRTLGDRRTALLEEKKEPEDFTPPKELFRARPAYEPPNEQDWIKQRDAALSKLSASKSN